MGVGRVSSDNNNVAVNFRLLELNGQGFYLDGAKVKIRMDDEGFSIGCTRMTWRTYKELKDILKAGE